MSTTQNPQTMSQDHAPAQGRRYDYGGNPLAREQTNESARFPAFGGNLEPGLFRQETQGRKFANPAPLGLCAFALTTFLLSLINLGTRGTSTPNIVIATAWGYGGLVQLLAGMWEVACGNTFGATALASYGGFWLSFAIIFTPGGFAVEEAYGIPNSTAMPTALDDSGRPEFFTVFSFYLFGWFIFTTLLVLACLKSTVAFFFLFFTLDITFLLLALGYYFCSPAGAPHHGLNVAGGAFGILAAFAAWYNALAGLLEPTNSFFLIPVAHFPWSEKGRERRGLPTVAQLEREKTNNTDNGTNGSS